MCEPELETEGLEIPRDWYFTWGFGQGKDNCYTIIFGTKKSARDEMMRLYGDKWGFQYASADAAGVHIYKLRRIL